MTTADRQTPSHTSGLDRIVAVSGEMLAVVEQARRAVCVDVPVLILGETGVGKRLLAEAIHDAGPRRNGPFLPISLTAIPDMLVDGDLFGQDEGVASPSGAVRPGRLAAANGGTVLLEQIGDLKSGSQARLLRLLEGRSASLAEGRRTNVRIIATADTSLERRVASRHFRADLYYLLGVITLVVPPLRMRHDDILPLARHFVAEACQARGMAPPTLAADLEHFLGSYDWPGNVEQLRNCMESMAAMSDSSMLSPANLPSTVRRRVDGSEVRLDIPAGLKLRDVERAVVLQTLEGCDGNRTKAARSLGISVRTLQRRLKRWHTGRGKAAMAGGLEAS